MPLNRTDSAAPSRRPYALNPDTFELRDIGASVEAVWLGRKDGRTRISRGTLRLYPEKRGQRPSSLSDFLSCADSRYGGKAEVIWDGEHLWTDPVLRLDPDAQKQAITELDRMLDELPDVPPDYDGWFRLEGTT